MFFVFFFLFSSLLFSSLLFSSRLVSSLPFPSPLSPSSLLSYAPPHSRSQSLSPSLSLFVLSLSLFLSFFLSLSLSFSLPFSIDHSINRYGPTWSVCAKPSCHTAATKDTTLVDFPMFSNGLVWGEHFLAHLSAEKSRWLFDPHACLRLCLCLLTVRGGPKHNVIPTLRTLEKRHSSRQKEGGFFPAVRDALCLEQAAHGTSLERTQVHT